MSVKDSAVDRSMDTASDELELLTDEDGLWTIVPTDAEGEERLTQWLSVEEDHLYELDDWQ